MIQPKYVRMTDLYFYLSSRDSLDIRKNNNTSEFWIQLPKRYTLEGNWKCALIEASLTCDFTPKSSRLYICSDIVEESYVRNTSLPVLRNIEVWGRFKKLKTEQFLHPTYIPVKVTNLNLIRIHLVDEDLNPVEFDSNDLHCVLHLKKSWGP